MAPAADEAPYNKEQPWQQADNADVVEHAKGKAMGLLKVVAYAGIQSQCGVVTVPDPWVFSDPVQGQLPELDAEGTASFEDFVRKQRESRRTGEEHGAKHEDRALIPADETQP
ncbi:hypothetical protein D3C78_1015130 [compost metagenome]